MSLVKGRRIPMLLFFSAAALSCGESTSRRADAAQNATAEDGGRASDASVTEDAMAPPADATTGSAAPDSGAAQDASPAQTDADASPGRCPAADYAELPCQGFWSSTLDPCERADGLIESDSCLRTVLNEVCPGFEASRELADLRAEDGVVVLRTTKLGCPGELRIEGVERCAECDRITFYGIPDVGLGPGCNSSCDLRPTWVALVKVTGATTICAEEQPIPCRQ